MTVILPKTVNMIINRLEENGYSAYAVGGCVRDIIMGKVPFDFDVTTSATPDKVKEIFSHTVDTGIKHGTVTVIEDGLSVEVTTFRSENGYTDSRHPDSVNYINSLKEDLSRRDFTVNAIAYNEREGIVDCFSGLEDIKSRILRTVGNPARRFQEDALRIIRLYRFASTLGFEIEEATENAAINCRNGLLNISAERIFSELKKMCLGKNLKAADKFFDLSALSHLGIGRARVKADISLLPESENLRLYAFLKMRCEDTSSTLSLLKADNKLKNYFKKLERISFIDNKSTKVDIKRALFLSDPKTVSDYIIYKTAIFNENLEKQEGYLKEVIENKEPYTYKDLKSSGEDLIKQGYRGEDVGKKLYELLERVWENPDCNRKL